MKNMTKRSNRVVLSGGARKVKNLQFETLNIDAYCCYLSIYCGFESIILFIFIPVHIE